jgi:hypothetical protein
LGSIIFKRLIINKLVRVVPLILLGVFGARTSIHAQQPRLEWDGRARPEPMLTLGLKPADALFPIVLTATRTPNLALRPRFTDWLDNWQRFLTLSEAPKSEPADAVSFLPELPVTLSKAARDTAGPGPGILPGAISEYADIGMMIRGRGELGGAWNRYSPCDPGQQLTCKPSLFPQLRPDVQFGVIVGGTISERVHVNVDYDQTREFDAANNINVYYQGLPDEIIQRVEVGDVSIRLPASRYLTQGIPAGNFGFKATGQLGPVDFQTVFAQQRGDVTTREFRLGGVGNAQGLVQDETLALDDADYVKGQFFFITDPDSIAGSPHIDVLTLRATDARASLRPAAGDIIEVYRDERPSALNQQQQAQLGYFLADATMPDKSRTHRGLFKRLEQGKDYTLHASGLWIMLRGPLRQDEALAISYVTETGDTVGTLRAESAPAGTIPTLRLLRGPAAIHQPNFPTWKYELHNVYRVHSSSTVDLASIQLAISLGQQSAGRTFANTVAGPLPYIKLFGLDEDAPVNALDLAQIYQPGNELSAGTSSSQSTSSHKINGTYVILPTLRPFADPAPVGSAHLTAAEAKQALASDANSNIYDAIDPVLRQSSARFRMNLQYRVRVEGLVSSFNLGAFGLREESERITIGGRTLSRGLDYNIDYDIGTVTLQDPQSLFATDPNAEIHATWEQKSQFQIAPTSVFGMNAHYQMGTRGDLNFVGLYQAEKTIMTRPELGVEPGAIFLGGTSGRFDFGGRLLDRALSQIPGLRLGGTSAFSLTGEAAFSMPNPNTRNQAYLDDFEGTDAITLSPLRRNWMLGSRPQDLSGTNGYLPDVLSPANAAQLVWQHDVLSNDGQPSGSFFPRAIDKDIRIAGNELPEPVMWLTLGDSAKLMLGERWRSITTVLSTTGSDLTRSEYIEFYVRTPEAKGKSIILDIGNVSEDAFYFDAAGKLNDVYPDGTRWGLDVLDAEARLVDREIWGPDKDERGLWNRTCTGIGAQTGALGDPNVNCARKNGYLDTEDLDGNGILDNQDGTYFRYHIPLDVLSPYLVRDSSQTGTAFKLYRIPLRDGVSINGASTSSWRYVKHLRMTVTSNTPNAADNFIIARMRIVGSRWVKRDIEGVNRGLLSDEKGLSAGTAVVEVGPVSRLTHGDEYSSPPQVREQLQDPSHGLSNTGEEFNEKGLSIRYKELGPQERAEIYFRYPQQPRSFLNYRQLQLWAVAKTGNFGPSGDQRLVVKIGTDPRNYYFYQSRLKTAIGAGTPVAQNDWAPQVTIDFEEWFELKAKAELALLQGQRSDPTKPFVVFNADSTYGIVLEDRARAPNLAAIRELSFGVYNGSGNLAQGEVWLNDVRLASAFRDAGAAGNISLDLRGGDFLATNLTYQKRGSIFRQLNQDATYVGNGDLTLSSSAQLGQMMPASWDLDMPLTLMHTRSAQDPNLLESSDVQAARLPGLRDVGANLTRVGLSIRKRTPSANPIIAALVDGLALRVGYNKADNSAITLRNEASGIDGSLSYAHDVVNRDLDILPGFVEAFLRFIAPSAIENSGFFKRVTTGRLRYTPARIAFGLSYANQERNAYQFNTILVTDSDAVVKPIESPRRSLDTDATISLQPFRSLTGNVSLRQSRDLLPTERASTQSLERAAIAAARGGLAGMDLGYETNRSLTSDATFQPIIADWIRPSVTLATRFGTDRSPSYLEIVSVGADTTAFLQRRFQADRQLRRQLELRPFDLFSAIVRDTVGFAGTVNRLMRGIQPIRLAWRTSLGSQFDRNSNNPGLSYQLALGDLQQFRVIGVDSAVAATELGNFDATTSLRLTNAAQLDMQYTSNDLQAFDHRGGTRLDNERTWPNLRLSWTDVGLPSFVRGIIPRLGLSASYVVKERAQALGAKAADRGMRETSVPFSARFSLPANIGVTYAGNWMRGESDDPTGDAEQGGLSHNINLTATVRPPQSLSSKLKTPIRANLGLTQNSQHQCRFRQFADATQNTCVSFIDFRNRTLNLTLDTNVSDLIVGMQMGYTSRQDMVGTRRGSSQFQLGIFANFELPVGQIPMGSGGVR